SAHSEETKYETGPVFQFGIAVANANITLKRGPQNIFIFVTNLTDAKPVPNATVTVYIDGKAISTGKTDGSGAVQLPASKDEYPFILTTAEAPGVFGAWYNAGNDYGWRTWSGDQSESKAANFSYYSPSGEGYAYTDRPIYRPGDTVHFRGVL